MTEMERSSLDFTLGKIMARLDLLDDIKKTLDTHTETLYKMHADNYQNYNQIKVNTGRLNVLETDYKVVADSVAGIKGKASIWGALMGFLVTALMTIGTFLYNHITKG